MRVADTFVNEYYNKETRDVMPLGFTDQPQKRHVTLITHILRHTTCSCALFTLCLRSLQTMRKATKSNRICFVHRIRVKMLVKPPN
jgi:hypothetical protein